MDLHKPYETIKKRKCDFIVKYRFLSTEEGGRKTGNPVQAYRCDFLYAEDENIEKLWMIWPEFLDDYNNVILDKSFKVPTNGKAQMWIINENMSEIHKERIKIGLKAFFMEGPKKVAECEVIEILNPSLK